MMFRIVGICVCCVTALFGGPVQTQPASATSNSTDLINEAAHDELICSRTGRQLLQESNHVDGKPISVDWLVLGHRFTEYFALADYGTDVRWAFSPSSTPEAMAESLAALGHTITREVVPMPKEPGRQGGLADTSHQLPTPVHVATRQTPDSASRIVLAAGYYPLMHGVAQPKVSGLTLICTPADPNEKELERLMGMWSTARIEKVVSAKGTLPVDLIEKILSSEFLEPLQALAGYHALTPVQVERLLARDMPLVDLRVVANLAVELSDMQIDALVARRNYSVGRALIMHRLSRLTSLQRKILDRDPGLAELLVIREGGKPALALLKEQLRNKPDNDMYQLLRLYDMTADVVDAVLDFGSSTVRGHLAMQGRFVYTPAQIERMLIDANPEVQIGVLRRRELSITREQYDRGLRHSNKNVVFWYGQRNTFAPDADQIESALTSPEPSVRRGIVLRKDLALTADQVKRTLKDPALRALVIERPDVKLSESELDDCIVDSDVRARFACVRRLDFTLNEFRWRCIARDKNPNVLRFFLQRSPSAAPVDWAFWLEKSLKEDPPEVQQNLLRERLLPFTPELLRIAANSRHTTVRRSACQREPGVCP